jgi:hypothetical protein
MFSFFLIQLGLGVPACAALVPTRLVGRGYYILNGVIGGACLAIAYGMGGDDLREGTAARLFWCALVCLGVYLGLQFTRWRGAALAVLAPGIVAGGALLVRLAASHAPSTGFGGMRFLFISDALLGALLLGSVLAAMNLGHWYLVIPGLPISILKRLTLTFALALGGRIVLIGAVGYLVTNGTLALPDGFLIGHGIFVVQRILFGFAVPILLSVMIWRTVVIRSTQSATGILYVAVFFILMGELISTYLRFLSGVPI